MTYCPVGQRVSLLLFLAACMHTLQLIIPSLCCAERSLAQSPLRADRQDITSIHTVLLKHTFMHNNTRANTCSFSHVCAVIHRDTGRRLMCTLMLAASHLRHVLWLWLWIHTTLGVADTVSVSFHLSALWQESSVAAGECSTYQIHSADLQLLSLHLPNFLPLLHSMHINPAWLSKAEVFLPA